MGDHRVKVARNDHRSKVTRGIVLDTLVALHFREACLFRSGGIFRKFQKGVGGVISDLKKFVAKFLALGNNNFMRG